MSRLIAGILIGVVIGGAVAYYLFVGVPSGSQAPGTPLAKPDASGQPPATVQIVLGADFFNEVLNTIFTEMNAPAFPLAQPGAEPQTCVSKLTVLREGSGTATAVSFHDNKLSAPIAFSGTYNSMFGCFQFTGWALANLQLRYDASRQAVFGQLNVETANLDGVNPVISGIITPVVQSTLNSRVNPILLIDGPQLAVDVPVAASGGVLRAAVSDVRGEVRENALYLHVTYDFQGAAAQPAQ